VLANKGEQHEVLAIVASRRSASGKVEYRIRWKGFSQDEDTWQTRETVEHTVVFAEFNENKENIPEVYGDDTEGTISDVESENVSLATTPARTPSEDPIPMEISLPPQLHPKVREPPRPPIVKSHTLPPRVRRPPSSSKRVELGMSPPLSSPPTHHVEPPRKRRCTTNDDEHYSEPVIFY